MFDIGASLDREILALMKDRPTVLFVEPEDPRVVEAALNLPRYARPVFLCGREKVEAVIREHLQHISPVRVAFSLSESAFCDLDEQDELREVLANEMIELPFEQSLADSLDEARQLIAKPAIFGIMAANEGYCDMVVGGACHEARDYFRPLLKVLQFSPVLIEAGVIVLPDDHPGDLYPHNILVIGDVGANATMGVEKLARIAVGTSVIARDLIPQDLLPEINAVMVSYSNHGSDEGPSPDMVRRAMKRVPQLLEERHERHERYRTINIQGEVKINVALSRRSARMYRGGQDQTDRYRGTNVIITPNLDTGNLLYHLFSTRYPDARKFGTVYGIRYRGVDLPMDVTPQDAVLAVKANILRLLRSGEWTRTPRDTFFPRRRVLAINPGSTSTKLAVYEGEQEIFTEELQHPASELKQFEGQRIVAQFEFRKQVIEKFLDENGLTMDMIDAVGARGGLMRPIPHGTYGVNEAMRRDLLEGTTTDHASNLGALIAHALVGDRDVPAFITDPVVVDEMEERCRITGLKEIRRRPLSHALNQIATAHKYARDNETFYEYLNLIVCHMGGGITIGAHRKGYYVDVNNGLDGEGPFTPQRTGSLPVGDLIRLCFSGKYTKEELLTLNKGRGGLIDLLGTADFRQVEQKYHEGDPQYVSVFEAMVYQISKWIASMAPAFNGEPVDRILLTGGMARSRTLVEAIEQACKPLGCEVSVYPGENELAALTQGVLRVLEGREEIKQYTSS